MRPFVVLISGLLLCLGALPAAAIIDPSLQMQLGNPSGATANPANHSHYLIQRAVESLDYSDTLGQPVWASWDLTAADVGSTSRGNFITDTNLPAGFYRVTTADYNGVGNMGFNRGHLCPSKDRTDNLQDNDAVFLMSNIMPQSALNNQSPWGNFEDYCRASLTTNELLIMCGPSGFGASKLPSGKVNVPSNSWKIVVCVPLGGGTALSRVTAGSRVIAISIPNATNGLSSGWTNYLTSPQRIEQDTGFTFFSALPPGVAAVFRAKVDGAPQPGITNVYPNIGAVGTSVIIRGTNFVNTTTVWFNGINASFTINSINQITAIVPAGATTGPVSLVDSGGMATSLSSFTVTAFGKPGIQTVAFVNGQFSLTITGSVATSYTILAATNLTNPQWAALLTTNPVTLPFTFVDTNRLPQRFYRVQNP